jgi:hypothetical protein
MTHTRTLPRRWPRRLLLLLPGTVVALVLLLAGALLILDDADYKRILEWATDTFLDSELEIAGPFSLNFSDGIHVTAGDVRLRARDGSYSVSAHEFSTYFRVVSILSGALVIHDLTLSDGHLRIEEMETGNGADFSMPPVVVARAHFKNLTLEYQEAAPGTLHSLSLYELVLDDVNDAGPLDIRARGLFEGREYDLSGTLPPLAAMLESDMPHPVRFKFNSAHLMASMDGQVEDFLKGRGLDIRVELHAKDVQEILEIFTDGIPRVGDMDATARLRGDYDKPGLEEIDISFHRGAEVSMQVTGMVDNILTGKGTDLAFSGKSSHPTVTSWLLFGKPGRVSSLSLDAKLQTQYGRIQLHDVVASARTSDGLELSASGNAELYNSGHVFAASDTGITVRFTAPTTAAFNLLDYKAVPELGAVNGTVRLLASRDAIGLYDAEVSIGNRQGQQSVVRGSVARIGLLEEAVVTGIDLEANLRSSNVAALAKLAGYDLPQLGKGRADLHASGDLDKLRLSNVNISIGNADTLHVIARGAADRLDLTREALPQTADFNVTASIPQLADLSRYFDVNLPALGRMQASSKLKLRGKQLEFTPLQIDIGAADQPVITLNGKAITILQKGSSIDASFDVAATDLLMAFTDMKPGYLGRLEGAFALSSMDGNWRIQQFRLSSAQTQLYQLYIGGEREDFNRIDLANVKATLSIRNPEALGNALNIDLSGFSPWTTKGILSTRADTLVYQATGSLGSTTSSTLLNGFLKDGKPHFTGKMEIPVLYLKDFGYGSESGQKAGTPASYKPDKNYIFSREPLDVSFLKRFNLDFDLLIDQVESHGDLSIDSINGKIKVLDGKLGISPLTLVFEGGRSDIRFDIDANGVPAYSLKVSGDDIVLGPLMAQVQKDVPITGYSNLDMDLRARGRSPHDLVSSLNGDLSIGLENARIPTKYIELLSVDVFGWAFSKTRKKESYADLNCVVVAFDVNDGKLDSRTLIADGPSLTVAGHIKLDLGAETMNILLIPKQKKRMFTSAEPVKIRGPIMNPKVEAIPVKAAIQEVGAMALLPTVVIPVRVLGKLWSLLDDGDQKPGTGCASLETVTESAEKQLEK